MEEICCKRGREESENLRLVIYFPGQYSLLAYAGVWAAAFVVIMALGTGFSGCLFWVGVYSWLMVCCQDF